MGETSSRTPSAETSARFFATYSFLMAVGIILHQTILCDWVPLSHHTALLVIATFTMLRPSSPARFLTMVTAHLTSVLLDMPYVVNHWIATGFVDVLILIGAARLMLARRTLRITGADLFAEFAPALRILIVLLYAFAALAKLNWGFFHPENSAAVELYQRLAGKVSVMPRGAWTSVPVIWSTVLLELALPFMLIIRRTRIFAVFAAAGFHFLMGLAGFIPFSGIAMAYLCLFLPEDLFQRFETVCERMPWIRRGLDRLAAIRRNPLTFPLLAAAWIVVGIVHSHIGIDEHFARKTMIRITQLVFGLYFPGACLLVLLMMLTGPVRYARGAFRSKSALLLIVPLLLIVNGLNPYVGLKTESSFTMFSNLQTEADQWNHLFMPRGMRVFSMQDELVRIQASNDRELHEAAADGIRWTWYEFHRYLYENPDVSASYEYRGKVRSVERAGDDPIFSKPPGSFAASKILWFRDIQPADKNMLRH